MTAPTEAEVRAWLSAHAVFKDDQCAIAALALLDELQEARKDRERLDWIDRNNGCAWSCPEDLQRDDGTGQLSSTGCGCCGEPMARAVTFRAAIDQARGALSQEER